MQNPELIYTQWMASHGVYVFRRNGRVSYVGRGIEIIRRMKESWRQGKYDLKARYFLTSSERQSYLLECKLFHKYEPCDNQIHPAVPAGTNWRCPVKGCSWS